MAWGETFGEDGFVHRGHGFGDKGEIGRRRFPIIAESRIHTKKVPYHLLKFSHVLKPQAMERHGTKGAAMLCKCRASQMLLLHLICRRHIVADPHCEHQ